MSTPTPDLSTGAQPTFKRRILFIKKGFQWKFILKYCVVVLVAMMLNSALVYFFSRDTITASYRYSHLSLEKTADAIIPQLVGSNAGIILAVVIVVIYVTLYISHKIAGPLYRFEQDLKQVADGNLKVVFRLREADQLKDFVAVLNLAVGGISERLKSFQGQVEELREKVSSLPDNEQSIKKDVEKLNEELKRLFNI